MNLSDLYTQLNKVEGVNAFAVYLAEPDRDGLEVDLASIGLVEVDVEQGEVRIHPVATDAEVDSADPEPYLGMVLQQLPVDATGDNDLRLMSVSPLLREELGAEPTRQVELAGIHIGQSEREVWLLLRPPADFAEGLMPI